MTLGIMRRSLSNVLLVVATASLVVGLAHCDGGSDLNPQPLPPSESDKGADQGGGTPQAPSESNAGGGASDTTTGSAGTSGSSGSSGSSGTAPGPGPTDAGADADGGR